MEDLGDSVQEVVKKANKVLDATAAAKVLEGLGIGSGGSSEIKQISEAFSGLATGLKGIGELQAAVLGQVKENIGNGKGNSLSDLIGLILITKLLEPKQEKKEEISPAMERLLNRLEEEIRELKESRGPSPIDQQMHSLTTQLLSQHIATLADPFAGLTRLAEVKDKLRNVLGETSSVPPEYSEGALRLRALEKEEKALAVDESKYLAELNHKERLWSQQIPAVINQAGAVLANVLGAYGLVPTRPLQFDQGAAEAAEKMAQEVE
jgi:hypothetical protein